MMILDTKLTCPKCGCESPWGAFDAPTDILEIHRLAAKFGNSWSWVEEYLHCFRTSFDKPIRPLKTKIILEELLSYIDQTGFHIDKHWHTIRPDAVFAAVRYVAQLNKVGFKNHNYLKRVAIDMNQKMIGAEEKGERSRAEEALKRDPMAPERMRKFIKSLGR